MVSWNGIKIIIPFVYNIVISVDDVPPAANSQDITITVPLGKDS